MFRTLATFLLMISMCVSLLGLRATPMEAGLVGWWTFDEAAGGDALDSSGNGQTAVSNGQTTRVDANSELGGIGLAADFSAGGNADGENFFDLGEASSSSLNPGSGGMSIAAWVKVLGNGGGGHGGPSAVFGFGDCCASGANGAADRHALEISIDDNPQRAIFAIDTRGAGGSEAEQITSGFGATVGVWHHLVGIKRADGTASFHVNGGAGVGGVTDHFGSGLAALEPDGTVDAASGSGPLHVQNRINIGRNPFADPSGDRAFNGHLGDVQLYHQELSDEEGAMLFQNPGGSLFTNPQPGATVFEWTASSLGLWGDASNWSPNTPNVSDGGLPSKNNHTALFGELISGPTTPVTHELVTVNRVEFNNATRNYAIAGTGSINLATSTAADPVSPSIAVVAGSHEFQLAVNLQGDTVADINSDATLTFNNALNLGGQTLTKSGDGAIVVNNQLNSGGGALIGLSGTISGSGTVGGNLDNTSSTVAPGNSPGVLTLTGHYTQGSGGTLEIEVTGTSAGESGHDQLSVTGAASLDGTLDIVPQAPYADPSVRGASENMVILTAGTVTGTFSTVNYDGNALTADFGPDANGSIRDHVGSGLFRSVIYSDSNVTVQNLLALEGDTDGDKDVDITDFNSLSTNFDPGGNNSATNDWIHADFDLDGDIDITDFNALSANFAPGGYAASSPGQIPEPTTSVLLILGLASAILAFRGNGIFRCEG